MRTPANQAADVKLKSDVLAELQWEPSVDESKIGVLVDDGIVTLNGTVQHWAQRSAAERAAQRIYGVQAVANEIQTQLPENGERSDADIARAAAEGLRWHVFIPRDRIQVAVAQGWVTLTGDVDSQYQKTAADSTVHHLWGVKGVVNEITIESGVSPMDLKEQIMAAIGRYATIDAGMITIDAEGGMVKLRGTVRSWMERDHAEIAAWSAPGVSGVENELKVSYPY
jgi:osmotically-inducible protein OsmY